MKTAVLPSVQHRRRGDPGGFNSDGLEIQHGAEPAGTVLTTMSPSSNENGQGPPATPTRKEKMDKNVMALLLDAPPPPPPPTPPPKKNKQRAQSSMRPRQGPSPKNERKTVDDLMLKSEKAKDDYIQERLQSARAIYASSDMMFEDPVGDYRGRPSVTPTSTRSASSRKSASSKGATPPPPATFARTDRRNMKEQDLNLQTSGSSSQSSLAKRPPTPDARKAATEQERGRTEAAAEKPRSHSKTPMNRKSKRETPKSEDGGKKKGFFKKIFGKKNKKKGEDDNTTLSNGSQSKGSKGSAKKMSVRDLGIESANSGSVGQSFDFFAHDDVSTLTAPTYAGKRRQDPEQLVLPKPPSDPLGNYWNKLDAFAEKEETFDETVETAPGNEKAQPAPSPLSVSTPQMQNLSMREPSPSNSKEMETNGESSDDPPLYLPSDDEDDMEEKKEDDLAVKTSYSSHAEYIQSKDSALPPPPPPPPRPSSTKSKRSTSTPRSFDEPQLVDSDTGLPFVPSQESFNIIAAAQSSAESIGFFAPQESEETEQKVASPVEGTTTAGKGEKETVMKLFSAYSGQFKTRQNKVNAQKAAQLSPRSTEGRLPQITRDKPFDRDTTMTEAGVKRGLQILRVKREIDIETGRSVRVVPVKKSVAVKDMSYMGIDQEPEPLDPIQRAGRRLLAKAAVPIQSACRRYLAQCEAIDRMWALMEIQCYFRRWRARAFLLANTEAAKTIQRAFRLRRETAAAIQIQRIVRGYLASMETFDAVYMILLIQAKARGNFARDKLLAEQKAASTIQNFYRTKATREEFMRKQLAATKIQAEWRCYSARIQYQFDIVDIIIAQSVVRRWRTMNSTRLYKENLEKSSSIKIQAAWRGFQGYTDYIFTVIDILVIQRNIRRYLARKHFATMRVETAATTIQKHWRRQRAQTQMLYDFVHIILVQSVARRWLVNTRKEKQTAAALTIQNAWRGFWAYSHFIILQYEATRLQAIIRGNFARRESSLKIGSAIMIQAAVRKFLVAKNLVSIRKERFLMLSQMIALRQTNATRKLQFWWRVVMECQKEKDAALKIETFFFNRKGLAPRELRKSPTAKSPRNVQQKIRVFESKKEDNEDLLERVWLNTVDDDRVDVYAFSPNKSVPRSRPSPSRRNVPGSFDFSEASRVIEKAESFKIDKALRTARKLKKEEEKASAAEKYLKMYGIKPARSKGSDAPGYRSSSPYRSASPSQKKSHKIRVKDTYRDYSSIISGQGGFTGEEEV